MQNSSNKILQILGGFIAFGFGLLQGIDWLFTKYEIGNFYFNIILILLLLGFIVSIVITFKKNRNVNSSTKKQISKVKLVIGAPKENLKVIVYDELGHGIPRDTIIKYQANWYKQFSVK